MEIEVDEDLLRTVASGGQMDHGLWPALSQGIITRLDKIAHHEFPIPNLPPPRQHINPPGQQQHPPLLSSTIVEPPSSVPSSQDTNKENNQPDAPISTADSDATATAAPEAAPAAPASGSLPAQIEAMLIEINSVLSTFPKYPPHTIQRLAELILEPRRHYRHLASYLHAVDRVVHVTSGANIYPLPPAVPDISAMTLLSNGTVSANGSSPQDPAAAVSWGNSTNSVASTVGTDEALGGALLTPIPWLTRRPSPVSSSPASSNGGGPAEIRTESTETIDGPNGVGSIETVSVSVNGIPSMGASNNGIAASGRGITQEEAHLQAAALRASGGGEGGVNSPEKLQQHQQAAAAAAEEDNETPHARGPEEIGVDDLGPQSVTTSYVGGPGMEMQGIDVEAAVGRKAESRTTPPPEDAQTEDAPAATEEEDDDDAASETSTTSHPKRDANEELEGAASKKIKEDEGDVATAGEDVKPESGKGEEIKDEGGDKKEETAKPEETGGETDEVKDSDGAKDEATEAAAQEEEKTKTETTETSS